MSRKLIQSTRYSGELSEMLAQDEREAVSSYSAPSCEDSYGFGYVDGTCLQSLRGYRDHLEAIIDSIPGGPMMPVAQHERIVASLTRPAQTEQQPVAWADAQQLKALVRDYSASCAVWNSQGRSRVPLYAAPIAQTAPQPVSWTSLAKLKEVNDVGVASMWSGRVADDTDVALYASRPAQTAPQPEQSGLVEAAGAVIRAAVWWAENEDSPKSALAHFARAANVLRAALSAQGRPTNK